MYHLKATIKYYDNWCLAWLPEELDKYYRALLPRAWGVKPPMNKPHVSIVRKFESPDKTNWGLCDGEIIVIDIIPGIKTDGIYYWLNCFSYKIGYIRRSLGLSTFRDVNTEYPIYTCYHITIGNVKNV